MIQIRPADAIAIEAALSEVSKRLKAAEQENDVERLSYALSSVRDAVTKAQHLTKAIAEETRAKALKEVA